MLAISLHGLQAHKFHIVSQLSANAAIAAGARHGFDEQIFGAIEQVRGRGLRRLRSAFDP
jgi:hypothetical protein